MAEFQNLSQKAADYDPDDLWLERLKIRECMEAEARNLMQSHFGDKFSFRRMQSAESDVRGYLEQDEYSLRQYMDRKRREVRNDLQDQKVQKRKMWNLERQKKLLYGQNAHTGVDF